MTAAPAPSTPTTVNLSWRAKLWVAVAAVVSTGSSALINNYANAHFAQVQEVAADKKAAVEKVQGAIHEFNQLTTAYMVTVEAGKPSGEKRDALLASLMNQRDMLGVLAPALPLDQQAVVHDYQAKLVETSVNLRKSDGFLSTVAFGQSVSEAVDQRVAVVNAFRANAGMPPVEATEV